MGRRMRSAQRACQPEDKGRSMVPAVGVVRQCQCALWRRGAACGHAALQCLPLLAACWLPVVSLCCSQSVDKACLFRCLMNAHIGKNKTLMSHRTPLCGQFAPHAARPAAQRGVPRRMPWHACDAACSAVSIPSWHGQGAAGHSLARRLPCGIAAQPERRDAFVGVKEKADREQGVQQVGIVLTLRMRLVSSAIARSACGASGLGMEPASARCRYCPCPRRLSR